jgi:hypothetical protein
MNSAIYCKIYRKINGAGKIVKNFCISFHAMLYPGKILNDEND